MSTQGNQNLVKKKVKPYPFEAQIEVGAVKKPVDVMVITPEGLIAKLRSGIVSVGEYYQISFELPVMHIQITVKTRVIKTYDRSIDPKQHVVDRMAELRFEDLTDEFKKNIRSFMHAIGQK